MDLLFKCVWGRRCCRSEKRGALTVFDLGNVSHHDLRHRQLDELTIPDDGELLLQLDAALQPPELLLFAPVIEGCHEDHNDHRGEDGCPLDPAGFSFLLFFWVTGNVTTDYTERGERVIEMRAVFSQPPPGGQSRRENNRRVNSEVEDSQGDQQAGATSYHH